MYKLFKFRTDDAAIWYIPEFLNHVPAATDRSHLLLSRSLFYADFEWNKCAIRVLDRWRCPVALANNNFNGFVLLAR